ncbi:winged helix DNA-binding protein [Paenibacillus chartarius]|uniref:Winged helix DNA-binding protein n=1 Tax=Paenibacillus chartarius TaxID=747481 RepID=A0ABV6DPF4_9BACL
MKTIWLTPSQAEVITVLERWQPISLKELGAPLVCETGSPSRLLERMADDGLVDKIVNPNDARYVLLRLTEKGTAKALLIRDFEEQLYTDMERLFYEGRDVGDRRGTGEAACSLSDSRCALQAQFHSQVGITRP